MTQAQPRYLNRLLDFWNAADAVLARRGKPPLTYEQARDWFDCEVEPEDLAELVLETANPDQETAR